ncbi:MAG: hypothetical protein RMX63_34585 [Aulosira sp. ZfuCHP01]|nr:hypothetical protein [Aulosira sp. ZfuVER01]MDZ8056554.1 hypothetical protein [Aulosira sp. ZfuCHP01]
MLTQHRHHPDGYYSLRFPFPLTTWRGRPRICPAFPRFPQRNKQAIALLGYRFLQKLTIARSPKP